MRAVSSVKLGNRRGREVAQRVAVGIARTGQDAVYELSAHDVPLKKIAAALGTSETAARSYLSDYLSS